MGKIMVCIDPFDFSRRANPEDDRQVSNPALKRRGFSKLRWSHAYQTKYFEYYVFRVTTPENA
jgi:hypothetical protein